MKGNEIRVSVVVAGVEIVGSSVSYGSRIETTILSPYRCTICSQIYHPACVPKTQREFREYVEMVIRRSAERRFRKKGSNP